MENYWIVGANWHDRGDLTDAFVRRGIWQMGWSQDAQPAMHRKRDQIAIGDRIAIKQLLGPAQSNILIKAIGIVRDNDAETGTIYVDWILTNLEREVDMRGCVGTIYGPYSIDSARRTWLRSIFCL